MSLKHVYPAGQAGFRDHLDKKAKDWFRPVEPSAGKVPDVALLGAPLSKTSISHSGAFMFPQSVRAALGSFDTYDIDSGIDLSEALIATDLGDISMHVTNLTSCHHRIYETLGDYWSTYPSTTLFLLGGDHSITAPSARAFSEHHGEYGVIHFDAHHDMRNLEDGGPTNGTPFRTLLENNWVDGSRMVQIGLRNFANAKAYTEFALSKGVTLVTMNQLMERGLHDVLAQAVEIAGGGHIPIYVTFDLDVLDQAYAPGVPAPGPGGMDIWTALSAMRILGQNQAVKAFDWVCADPTVDVRNLTSRVAATLMLSAAVGIARRS